MAARLTTYLVAAIVATTLIAGFIVGAQRDDYDGPADLIVHNARIYTAGRDATRAEAVAIRGNQILRVGSEREIMRLERPQTSVIDARGASVLPGFNDAHVHLIAGGLRLGRIALDDATTMDQMLERIRLWADANPDASWVIGYGWPGRPLPAGQSPRQRLDAVVDDRPVVLLAQDGESGWVNSAALELAGISRRTPDPAGGTIVTDPRTGEPAGVLKGTAVALVRNQIPAPTREERARALRAAVAEAHANGITSVQNAGSDPEDFAIFEEARRSGELALRIYSALTLSGPFTNADRAQLLNTGRQYPDDPVFKSGAVKIAVEPLTADELNRSVRLIDAEGWQVMTEAADEHTLRQALTAYEHAERSNGRRDRRHRIEHAGKIDATDISRFERLRVLATVAPLESPASNDFVTLAAERVRLALGSNWPDAPLNPLGVIQAAVTAAALEASPAGSEESQRRTLETAVGAYTAGAAWASFDEQRKGTITPGMLADLVILSDDIFGKPATRLEDTQIAMTIFDGKVVYRRDRGTN